MSTIKHLALSFAALAAIGFTVVSAHAQVPRCAADLVRAGSICIDRYEASVWSIPASAKSLIKRVQNGKAKLADLAAGGATQLGTSGHNYGLCRDDGSSCDDVYAVSLAGVVPSANISWFQAQQACANAAKRLPTNGEWQQAVNGTPDPGPDNGTSDCNTASAPNAVASGSRSSCVSRFGAYDMVGNVYEWVEDWVPVSNACPYWGAFSNDTMCLSGVSSTAPWPGPVYRGGAFGSGTFAGPLDISAIGSPGHYNPVIGFRCAR